MTALAKPVRRVVDHLEPLKFMGLETSQRFAFAVGSILILAGMALESLPVRYVRHIGGYVRDADGQPLVPTVSLVVGGLCLVAAVWAATRAFKRGTVSERFGLVVLGLIAAGQFGAIARVVFQLADLHGFYMAGATGSTAHRVLTVYWGLTLLVIAAVAFALPLVLVVANILPQSHGPRWYRVAVQALARRRAFVMLPLLASLAIVGICALLPHSLQDTLGYSSPTISGGRLVFPLTTLNASVWQSFARLSFLPLVVGMWEGMESAKACQEVSRRSRALVWLREKLDYVVLTVAGGAIAVMLAIIIGEPLIVPAAILITGLVAVSTAGLFRKVAATPGLSKTAKLGFSEEWREAAPIGRVLLILAIPALIPFALDMWRGLSGPFRLPSDATSYVYFWRQYGIDKVPSVSIGGIFVHGEATVALVGAVFIGLLTCGALFNTIILREKVSGLGKPMWLLVPLAAMAAVFGPVLHAAEHPESAALIAACALPAFLLMDRSKVWEETVSTFVLAFCLLGAWCYVVWHYGFLPPFAVLLATILWRFGLDAKSLNERDTETRARRVASFAALALLGLGMLVLGHGGVGNFLPSSEFGDVSDRIAVALVAPIWLVHIATKDLVRWAPKRAPKPATKTPRRSG
jgi:hypothetical protein